MLKIESICMRDEMKFPKVSSGLLCGIEEDHFCLYESPQIQAAIYIVTILRILKEWLLEFKRISVLISLQFCFTCKWGNAENWKLTLNFLNFFLK
jgi:hypothetical protein